MPRPRYEPTQEQRRLVQELAGLGLPQPDIARIVGHAAGKQLSDKKLTKHVRAELDLGQSIASMRIARTLFQRAMDGELGALIFWTKARMGWSEKVRVEASGPGGEPLQATTFAPVLYLPAKDTNEPKLPPSAKPASAAASEPPADPGRPQWRRVLAEHANESQPRVIGVMTRGHLAIGKDAADTRHR